MGNSKRKTKATVKQWPYIRFSKPENAWLVDTRTKNGGSRKFFAVKQDAETFAQQARISRENSGTSVFGNADLARYGKSVQDAITFYITHLRQEEKTVPLAKAIAELVALKRGAGRSAEYCSGMNARLGRFAHDSGLQTVAMVDSKTLDAWLAGLRAAPATRNTFRRDLITLFSFCQKRGYCVGNPALATEVAKTVDGPPGILTTTETEKLLAVSETELVPYIAISFFAGLRTEELEKLDWQNVNLDSSWIEVTAKNAKTARRRLVKIEPNLVAWLIPHARTAGLVTPINKRKRFEAARQIAGFDTTSNPWPHNAGRHSYGSYHLAQFKDAAALALQMGNSPQMIFQHYRELVKPKDAERYWNIKPSESLGKIVNFAASKAG